jgi:elongation factor Ts
LERKVLMQITASMVKELRERTGAPMMDCKQSLVESGGDLDKAIDILRKKGLSAAAKKAGRATAEGSVASYIHGGGSLGVLVEINCETDFVARTEDFQELVKDVAMHIAAADPRFIRREEVTSEVLDHERDIYREQALAAGKPEQVVDRIVDGKMEKFFSESVLMEQAFIKDADKTVGELVAEVIGKLGENIQISRFSRFKLGEGQTGEGGEAAFEEESS